MESFKIAHETSQASTEALNTEGNQENQRAVVDIEPGVSLIDEEVKISVSGLAAHQSVTLRAKLTGDGGEKMQSLAHYRANTRGQVYTSSQPALGGSYTGVESMGLMWAMKPAELPDGNGKLFRLTKRDVTKPYRITVEVLDSFVSNANGNLDCGAGILAMKSFQKWYMSPGVQRIPVREGNIRGTLFLPPGRGPFSGIIDVFGSAGGLLEFKASLLASRGFAALALAYFAHDDLPKTLAGVDLSYFHEAVYWMLNHPKVSTGGIGLMGISKGADYIISLAIQRTDIKAIVWISGAHAISGMPMKFNGKSSDFLKFEPEHAKLTADGVLCFRDCYPPEPLDKPGRSAVFPVERMEGSVLLVCGMDDQSWNSEDMAERILKRMERHGKGSQCTLLKYPGAGHLIEPPFTPMCRHSYNKVYKMGFEWGGETKGHSIAQKDSWAKIIKFFRSSLDTNLQSNL